jgi:hypothetical protein
MANERLEQIGLALQGFGAGVSGQLPQFQQALAQRQERQQLLSRERVQAAAQDALGASNLLGQGRADLALQLLGNRRNDILNLGGDPTETDEAIAAILSGDPAQLAAVKAEFDDDVAVFTSQGLLPQDDQAAEIKEREIQVKERGAEIREQELEFRRQQADAVKLSPTVQKILDSSQTAAFSAGESARELELLADDINNLDIGGGVPSTFTEKLKTLTGSTEAVSDLRRRFRGHRSSRAVSNLPPGVASDKDIELALSGFPPENANNQTINSFLLGQAKLARIEEAFNTVKSELVSETGSTSGLLKKWRSKISDEDFQDSIFSGIQGISAVTGTGTGAAFQQPDLTTVSDEDLFNF